MSEDGKKVYDISALASGPVQVFIQPTVDITGGIGIDDGWWPYAINGNNDLIQVELSESTYYYTYTLTYEDEDHPNPDLDALYDLYRLINYGRIEDIETFWIYKPTNQIFFVEIWSNDKTFAYPIGQHGNANFPVRSSIYIAVWNHAMDIDDDNPSLAKTEHNQ